MPPFTLRRFAEPVSLADWAELQAEARRLEVLVLHACSLDTLAGLPSALPALIELNLSSNNLSSLATVGRRGMASLRKLDLSSNRLRGAAFLPGNGGLGGCFFPALEQLLVPYNGVTSLEGIGAVAPQLLELDARSNRLQSGVESLQQLRVLPVLKRLELRSKQQKGRERAALHIFPDCPSSPSLPPLPPSLPPSLSLSLSLSLSCCVSLRLCLFSARERWASSNGLRSAPVDLFLRRSFHR
jgi:hypothetical protein